MTPNYKSWYLGILLDIRKKDLETQRELLSMLSDLARQTGTENALKAAKSPMAKYLRKLSMVWTKNRSKLRSFRVSAEIDGENTILTAAKTCDRLLQQDFEPILNKGISREQGWVRVRGRQ
ncbi:hypothetical protein [Roseovarius sp.]